IPADRTAAAAPAAASRRVSSACAMTERHWFAVQSTRTVVMTVAEGRASGPDFRNGIPGSADETGKPKMWADQSGVLRHRARSPAPFGTLAIVLVTQRSRVYTQRTCLTAGPPAQASSAGRLDAIKQPGRTRMTTEFGGAPTLRSYIGIVRRRKWWIAAAALRGLAASLGLSLTQAKQYSATAQLLVQPAGSTALGVVPAAVTPTDV